MKNMTRLSTIVCVGMMMVLGLTGCGQKRQEPEPRPVNRLTYGEVKRRIIEGQTTQAEIIETFGSPNLITRNSANAEVWNYNRMSYDANASRGGGGFFLLVAGASNSRATSSTTARSFDLIITFDKNDVVRRYKVISSAY